MNHVCNVWGLVTTGGLQPGGDVCAASGVCLLCQKRRWMSFAMQSKHRIKAGIEVILDIVLNHSAELDLDGPLFRCVIDNRSYYWIREDGDITTDRLWQHAQFESSGGRLCQRLPALLGAETCHVDGFRLIWRQSWAVRQSSRSDAPLFTAIQNCPVPRR